MWQAALRGQPLFPLQAALVAQQAVRPAPLAAGEAVTGQGLATVVAERRRPGGDDRPGRPSRPGGPPTEPGHWPAPFPAHGPGEP
ncbi:MAG: hypothetical protein ACRDSH_02120, partial [Pseudonocardiaceae bacterium]